MGSKSFFLAQIGRKGNFLAVRRSTFLPKTKDNAAAADIFRGTIFFFCIWQKKQRLTFMVEIRLLRLLFLNDSK
jgi:hypothetical protein